jgi:Arc/MetJ-type ribon-helix-helix transcriptional regulator
MSDDGTKVTIRMGPEEIQMMEDFMADHDIGNRSDFIRDAIKGYIASIKAGAPQNAEGGIFVRLNDVQLETLDALVATGITVSGEEFIRKCVLEKIVPKAVEDETIENAFRAAQMKAAYK